jgi:hypothetical protein
MTEYELKMLLETLDANSRRVEEAIKSTTFNLARIHDKLEKIEMLMRNKQTQINQSSDRIGLIRE